MVADKAPEFGSPDFEIEMVRGPEEALHSAVWDRVKGRCGNCGHNDPAALRLVLIVPEEAGGKRVPDNASLLCRACEMAAESFDKNPGRSRQDGRLVNFWVSRKLYNMLPAVGGGNKSRKGFKSRGSLGRYLMSKFLQAPDNFEDIYQYQDAGDDRVKVSIWVDPDQYSTFQELLESRGRTVTETLISLLFMYLSEVEPKVEGRNKS